MDLTQHLTNAHLLPQFIVSKITKDDKGHIIKVPCTPRGITSDHKNTKNWLPLEVAQVAIGALGPEHKLGFSITPESHLFFIDIDKALVDGDWSQLAKDICAAFAGCYIEVSQSGAGIHIMGRYTGPLRPHRNKNTTLGIELYTADRFVMFGLIHPQGDWSKDATEELNVLIERYFEKDTVTPNAVAQLEEFIAPLSDAEVLSNAKAYKSAQTIFGGAPSFSDLYEAREVVLARAYPSASEGKLYDASAADMALANMLAVHTECNKEQMLRLMWSSSLVRDKWRKHRTYLQDTVANAISSRLAILSQTQQTQFNESKEESQDIVVNIPQEYENCWYVVSEREVYTLQFGLLNQDAFNVCFGNKHLKDPPYKTFRTFAAISNRLVDTLGFRPDLPHGAITEREGVKAINTYKPLDIKKREGDMTPFFRFFNAMIPDLRDQKILLSYAATMAQKPGIKSQWCVVLQGVQGCGKSLFADFVAYACGEKYTHRAKGDEFENRFNSQWFGKTLILIEDPRLRETKLEETLKPLITSKLLAFEGKGRNVHMNDFPANFILTLNDFDLIQKRKETRRLAVFMSALQTPEDLVNVGMTNAEFRKIIDWKEKEGNEIFAQFIHNYEIQPEFDFSGRCVTAPETSSTEAVLKESMSEIEVALLEEIEQGRIGFKNGWISSTVLTDFLLNQRLSHLMPKNKRGRILESIGYVYHPQLHEGRAIRNLMPDNKRPALFIRKGHPALKITNRELIMQEYEKDQKRT